MAFSFESKKGKRILNFLFSIGASVVILGALFKILHWRFATQMLMCGMFTEVLIFAVYALLPPPADYYWERYYPNIRVSPADEKDFRMTPVALGGQVSGGNPALSKMDNMLQEADITPSNLKKLSESFHKLGTTVDKMSDISDVVAATGDYTENTKEVSNALVKLKETYNGAASAMSSFNNNASDTLGNFHEQIQQMTKNMSSLNAIYELELQDTNSHLKTMNSFYSNLVTASQSMAKSTEDAQKTQEQLAVLAKNLSSLNAIYGNMLSAMQGRA